MPNLLLTPDQSKLSLPRCQSSLGAGYEQSLGFPESSREWRRACSSLVSLVRLDALDKQRQVGWAAGHGENSGEGGEG